MSWFKIHTNEVLCTGLTNSELGIMVRYKALCEHFGIAALSWQQVCFNFDNKERKVVSKLFGILPEVDQKLDRTSSEVSPKLVGSSSKVTPKLLRSCSEVTPKIDNKNKELQEKASRAYYNNNINNIILKDKTRLDKSARATTPAKHQTSFDEVIDWESLFDYWEENKKGGRYKNAESRNRQLAKLKALTNENFEYAKRAIAHCVDNGYQGFCNGNELFYHEQPQQVRNDDFSWI